MWKHDDKGISISYKKDKREIVGRYGICPSCDTYALLLVRQKKCLQCVMKEDSEKNE